MSEAHLSAQHAQTRQASRVPAPDVDARRTRDPAGAAPQGPPPPVGLIWRVRDRATFVALRRSGCRVSRGPVTVTWLPGNPNEPPRVAYAVGRAVGRAVVRNRIRRRLRAITAESSALLRPGAYLIRVAPTAATQSYGELSATVSTALRALPASAHER
jgi:ribonuclease P protein component